MDPITIDELAEEVATRPRNARGHRMFPAELRRRAGDLVLKLRAEGIPSGRLADAVGVSQSQLCKWASDVRAESDDGMVPVTLASPTANDRLVLHGQCGVRVTGLDTKTIADVLRQLHAWA